MSTISAAIYSPPPTGITLTNPGSGSTRPPVSVDPQPDTAHISLAATRELLQLSRALAGQQNGDLSSSQSSQIDSQLKTLHSDIQGAKSGGPISAGTKQDINQLQNQISKEIFGYSHNGQPTGIGVPAAPVTPAA